MPEKTAIVAEKAPAAARTVLGRDQRRRLRVHERPDPDRPGDGRAWPRAVSPARPAGAREPLGGAGGGGTHAWRRRQDDGLPGRHGRLRQR